MFYSSEQLDSPKELNGLSLEEQIEEDHAHYIFHKELWDYDEHSISLVSSPLYHAAPAHMALTGHALEDGCDDAEV